MTSLIALPYADLHAHDRASLGWRINAAGALEEVAANALRVDYDPATLAARGVLVEPTTTNVDTNPRLEGAVAGTPGTNPTGGSIDGSINGLTRTVSLGTESGVSFLDFRWAGTATATFELFFFLPGTFPCVLGETASSSICASAWGTAPTAGVVRLEELGASVFTASAILIPLGGAPLPVLQSRLQLSRTFTNATTTAAGTYIAWFIQSGLAYNFTIRIALRQFEKQFSPTSVVLPPIGTPGASTRAADRITRTLGHRFSRTAFTLLARGLFAQAAPAGQTRGVLQLDDGTNANRIRVENTPGGSALQLVVTIGGADVATLPLGNMTPGTPFGVAMAFADGDLAAVRNGGTVQAAAVAVPPGLAFMRVGATGFDHANPMNGWYRAHRLLRGRLDNASLITLAA
jgi:hypothetical protein